MQRLILYLCSHPKLAYIFVSCISFLLNLTTRALLNIILIFNISVFISWVVVTFLNYFIQRIFFSNDKEYNIKELIKVYISGIGQLISVLIVSNIVIYLLSFFSLNKDYIYLISHMSGMGASFVLGYFLTRFFVFKNTYLKRRQDKNDTSKKPV